MATTLQQQQTNNNNNSTTNTSVKNPQLKRIVYSKYRELLGSYNDKANAIIDALPSYMVYEDRGFKFEPNTCLLETTIINTANGNDIYGTGQQTYEAPACVQNAMMTKDKKPFTYTPGGLDLSQIKSERMAKRLQRNAQAEGASGQSQMHRPTQPQSPGSGSPGSCAASMGAAAMGMPFQVLPPPPPPPPGKLANGTLNAPPPPPPPAQHSLNTATLAPSTNGGSPNPARKSPSPAPQRFEPPPMGFRPEIKIPANPMASLRKVPPPVEKNTFWKDAYIKDRSKSPMPDHDVTDHSSDVKPIERNEDAYKMPSNVFNNSNNQSYGKSSPDVQHPMVQQQKSIESPKIYQQQQPQRSPSPRNYPTARSTSPRPYQSAQQQSSSPRTEFRSVAPPQSPNVNVYTTQNANNEQRSVESPFKFASQAPQQQQQQPKQQQSISQTVPWRTQRVQQANNNMPAQQQQQSQQFTPSVEQETKPTNVGSLYIAPLQAPVEPQAQHIIRQMQQQQQQPRNSPIRQVPVQQQQQPQQQSQLRQAAPWMKSQPPPREQPEWVRADEPGNIVPSSLNRLKSPPPPPVAQQQQQQQPCVEVRYQSQAQPQVQPQRQHQPQVQFYPQQNKQFDTPELQQQQQQYRYNEPHSVHGNGFNSANPAPTSGVTGLRLQINTTSSGASNSGKEHIIPIQLEQTPTYSPQQPNFNVQATSGNKSPAGYVIRSPNQFVDQGYQNFANNGGSAEPQRIMSPTQQLNAPRLIQQQQQPTAAPTTQIVGGIKTRIIPIAVEGANAAGSTSKAPIVLQNGTYNLVVYDCPLEAEIRYHKNLLSDVRTTPIQSKSFRVLQHITDTMAGDEIDTGLGRKNENIDVELPQLQRPTFARQMSAQQARNSPTIEQMKRMQINSDQQQNTAWAQNNPQSQQQYVHPSQQQVPQPKIYTGSNIPSRSFKILQSITTPENADKNSSNDEMEDVKHVELNDNQNYNQNYDQVNDQQDSQNIQNSNTESFTPTFTTTSSSASSINQEPCSSKISNDNQCPHMAHGYPYPAYAYPYPYPWCPSPPPNMMNTNEQGRPTSWPYYPMPYPPTSPISTATSHPINFTDQPPAHINYTPYPYYYPYYVPPPPPTPPPYMMRGVSPSPTGFQDIDSHKAHDPYYPYPPPPAPYLSYPYPVPPAYTLSPSSSCASSVLPDIIITPSTDDIPSKVIMQHKVRIVKEKSPKKTNLDIEEVFSDSKIEKNVEYVHLQDDYSDTDSDDEKTPQGENVVEAQVGNKLCLTKSVKNFKTFENPIQKQMDEEYDSDVTTIEEDEEFKVYDTENKLINDNQAENLEEEVEEEEEYSEELEESEEEVEEESEDEIESDNEELNRKELQKLPLREQIKPIIIVTVDQEERSVNLPSEEKCSTQINNLRETTNTKDNDYDVFASLRAMKLQAQQLREKSVEYWGAPAEKKEAEIVQPDNSEESIQNTKEIEQNVDESEEKKPISLDEAKNNFWATLAALGHHGGNTTAAADKTEEEQLNTMSQKKSPLDFFDKKVDTEIEEEYEDEEEEEEYEEEEEEEEEVEEEVTDFVIKEEKKNNIQEPAQAEEEEVDFWAIIEGAKEEVEDDWTLKKKNVITSTFSENLEQQLEEKMSSEEESDEKESDEENESEQTEEIEEEIEYEEVDEEEEEVPIENTQKIEQNFKNEDEVDFWAEIEKSKSTSFRELNEQCADIDANKTNKFEIEFDPTKYPEEPREVDTDEEIDFWAEIEDNRKNSDEFLGFRQAANLWASRGRAANDSSTQIDTEIKKEAENFDIELFKGVDPIFINENTLQDIKEETEPTNNTVDNSTTEQASEDKEEVDMKRSNYRKAMAVFSTPIDEQKDKVEANELCQKHKEITQIKTDFENGKVTEIEQDNKEKKQTKVSTLTDLGLKGKDEIKLSVRDRVNAFESVSSFDKPDNNKSDKFTLSVESYTPKSNLSRNSSQRSESGGEEEDSGVTDMNRQLSETDTDVESFPELRKMSTYQRASTHSRLFKLLQDETCSNNEEVHEEKLNPSRRKIVHNVSITRRQNPSLLKEAESMAERRERLSLPLTNNKSIDADNPSTPNSPASPLGGDSGKEISDQLVKELVESLLLRSDSTQFRDLPMEKLQAAAKRALEEELDSLENTSVETTPNTQKDERTYADYYDSWSDATSGQGIMPSKTFRTLQDRSSGRKSPWTARCPRVLSSKTINSDLARVTESPEIMSRNSPLNFKRESSINKYRKY